MLDLCQRAPLGPELWRSKRRKPACGEETTSYRPRTALRLLICRLHLHHGELSDDRRKPFNAFFDVTSVKRTIPCIDQRLSLAAESLLHHIYSDPGYCRKQRSAINLAALQLDILPFGAHSGANNPFNHFNQHWSYRPGQWRQPLNKSVGRGREGGGASNGQGGWSRTRGVPREEVQHYMSQSSAPGERSLISSPRPLQANPGDRSTTAASPRPGTAGTPHAASPNIYTSNISTIVPRPSAQHESPQRSSETIAQPQNRGFGVHSILNPSSDAVPLTSAGSAHVSAPGAGQPLLQPPTASPRSRKRAQPASPTRTQYDPALRLSNRRVLTPRSPATRAASLGGRRTPTFLSTGPTSQPLTGPEPRIYSAEPGTADIPSLPPLTGNVRPPLPSFQATDAWSSQGRSQQGQGGSGGPPIGTTQTASPSTSHTSQSQVDQTSPAFRYGTMPPSQQPQSSFRQQHLGQVTGYPGDLGPRGVPENYQAGQPAYQMTLETDQGPMVVPVELDLQQASKMADEKRKRNAGASARFRARRKEKEKEASHTISSLQQDLREAREARDFYRNERNHLRDFVTRQVGVQLPPRPPSPLFHRRAAPPISMHETDSMEDIGRARSDSAPALHRRRTTDYQPQFSTQQSPVQHSLGSGYGPPTTLPLPQPTQGQGPAPGSYTSPLSLAHATPTPLASGLPRSQSSYDPFRKDPFDKSWNPAR